MNTSVYICSIYICNIYITLCPPRDLCQITKCKSEGEMFTYFMSQRRSNADMWHLFKCQVKTFIPYPAAITHQCSVFSFKRPLWLRPPINSNNPWSLRLIVATRKNLAANFTSTCEKFSILASLDCCIPTTLIMRSLCPCLTERSAFNVEIVGFFYDTPILHEHRNHINLQNWVIPSTKWIPGKLITLATDMQRCIRQLAEYWEDCVVISLSVMIIRVK